MVLLGLLGLIHDAFLIFIASSCGSVLPRKRTVRFSMHRTPGGRHPEAARDWIRGR
ncbi:MAG: hypothetical protein JWN86_2072 [Planctomycetota bacterium]|nr:hypothetical protein [Planctomycetota bacterium]